MADQTFAVNSGFYDAVNSDRTYSADDMNRPYKRLVSNGVFATPQGTKSTDLQVVAAGGMQIIVKAGEGIFADKWFENPAAINITVPNNTSTSPRIDSVIVQVDKRTSGRVGNIVYRTGTPSSNPSAPAINTTSNVIEYRIANVRVAAGAVSITGGVITDRRGSSDCPWITSLIYQVDTSTLYDQWAAAYAEYFETEKAMWDDWYSHLTEELDVSMTLVKRTNTVVTASDTSEIEIGIPDFNTNTDLIEVYINGLKAIEGVQYTVNDNTSISLTAPVNAGQVVSFVIFKSVIMGNDVDIMSLINALEERIASIQGGYPTVVDNVSDMTDTDKIYILSTDSKWYYYSLSSSDWVIGGTYGGVPTDTTLTQAGMAADAKTVGDAIALTSTEIEEIQSDVNNLKRATPTLDFNGTTQLASGADLNTLYNFGSYSITSTDIAESLLNKPEGFQSAGRLFVMRAQSTARTLQILFGAEKEPIVYIRYWHGSAWWSWYKFAYTDIVKVSNGELSNVNWHVGAIETNGYPRESNHGTANKRILSDYIFVGQNTTITVTDTNYQYNISKYDLDKVFTGTFPASGWARTNNTAEFTEDCYIRIMMRKEGDLVITDTDIPTMVGTLDMKYYTPTADDYRMSDGIPSYYDTPLSTAVEAIRNNMNACGQNGDTFIFITDLHWDPLILYKNRNARRSPMLVKKIIEETGLKKIIFGGDYFTGNDSAEFEFDQIHDLFTAFNIKNTLAFPIIGNHDFNGYNTRTGEWDKNTAYAQIIKQCENYTEMGDDLNYYYDNIACKTRYIFLNTKDTYNRWQTADNSDWTTQLQWFETVLNGVQTGYKIVVFMHIYYDVGSSDDDYAITISKQGTDVSNICDTFNTQNTDKKVRAIISGHAHRDYNSTTSGGIPVILTDCDSSVQVLSGRDATWDTTGENCFDVMTIDYTNNNIKTVRIGRGGADANRTINL